MGFWSLAAYIAYEFSGKNEPYISPPPCPELRNNPLTPSDLNDALYVDQEELDDGRKPAAKTKNYGKEG